MKRNIIPVLLFAIEIVFGSAAVAADDKNRLRLSSLFRPINKSIVD